MSVPCACIIARRSISHTIRVADKTSYDSTPTLERLRVVQAQVVEQSRCRRGRDARKSSEHMEFSCPERALERTCRVIAFVPTGVMHRNKRRADCNARPRAEQRRWQLDA